MILLDLPVEEQNTTKCSVEQRKVKGAHGGSLKEFADDLILPVLCSFPIPT